VKKFSAMAVLAVAPAIAGALLGADGLELVKRAVARDAKTTYTCIREWSSWGSKEVVRVRRDQRCDGANKIVVLAPISKQGYTIIDDAKQRTTYNPDKRELTLQDSPLAKVPYGDTDRRIRLIAQNYRIETEGSEKVASRRATRVRLEPLSKDTLFARWYWIDDERSVLLRVKYRSPGGELQTMSDTLSIEFPKELPTDTFARRFVGELKEIRVQAPKRQKDLASLSRAVGFPVVNPVQMPSGFLFIGADAIAGRNRTMAAMRYTDGAANLTIYQASAALGPAPWRSEAGLPIVLVDGIWLTVDGDLPAEGKRAVLAVLNESTGNRIEQLTARAAKQFGVDVGFVAKLRSLGLDMTGTVVCLSGGEERAFKMSSFVLMGKTQSEMAREMRLSEAGLRSAQKRFWDMR